MQRVVIAPDSFKGSAPAAIAADAIAAGWRAAHPDDDLTLLPQADGGEGTLDAIASAVQGSRFHRVRVTGPDGREVDARWLEVPTPAGSEGVVELAESSGLPLMAELDAAGATTAGLGSVLRAAIDAGMRSVVIGLGGSASTDGGAGALQALGLSIRDAAGAELGRGGRALSSLATVDAASLLAPPSGGVRLLTDVSTPLLGERGAAAAFGPQKGATTPAAVAELEDALATWARVLGGDPDAPGAGAAGGTAYGFATAWGAQIVPGAPAIATLTGLDAAAAHADVLILGEGRFDRTSLEGKVVGHALGLAGPRTRVVVIAGRVDAEPHLPDGRRAASIALADLAGSAEASLADPLRWLREAGTLAARD